MTDRRAEAARWLMGALGAPYFQWPGGAVSPTDGPPAWAVNAPVPPIEEIRWKGGFCVAVPSLMQRYCGVKIPPSRYGEDWDGGTVSTYEYYYDHSYWYENRVRSGIQNYDLLVSPYREGSSEGHVGVVIFYEGTPYVFEWLRNPGLTWDFTLEYSHNNWGYYEIVVPAEVWLPVGEEPAPIPDEEPDEASDEDLIAAIDPYLSGQGATIVKVAREERLTLSVACGLVEQESNGRNIFGCDYGNTGDYPPYCGQAVTRERVQALRDGGNYGHGMNGVGLTQLTWWTYVEEAEALGGAHLPENQCRVGFSLLKDLMERLPYMLALGAYNAGEGNAQLGIDNGYAGALAAKIDAWEKYLPKGGLPPPGPEPDPEERDVSFATYTFCAYTGQPTEIANAAVLVLESMDYDCMAVGGDKNIREVSRQALEVGEVGALNAIVVGPEAYTRLDPNAKAQAGWNESSTIWSINTVDELTFVRNYCVPWIARGDELAQQLFDDVLLSLDRGTYEPLIEESKLHEPVEPDPPDLQTLEQRVAALERWRKEVERGVT